jgi:hypothetical protein
MNQPFDSFFDLHKGAVGNQVDHPAVNPRSDGVFAFDSSHGLGNRCFKPSEMRSFSMLTSSTTTSISCPT